MISHRTVAVCSALAALGMTALMPSSESLWIDEAHTFHHVAQPTFSAFCSSLLTSQGSEGLMPLGMFAAWLGGQLIGMGEWQMRAPNILWAALTVLAFVRIGQLWDAPWAPIAVAVQPFLWYYADEARPYALQMACAAWLAAGCAEVLQSHRFGARVVLQLLVASAGLIAVTMFGIVTVGAVAVGLSAFWWRERWVITRAAGAGIGLEILWCAGFGAYYVWKVASGSTASKIWEVGLQNLGFALYEFTGFAGLGPGREELRELAREGGVEGVVHGLATDLGWLALLAALIFAAGGALWTAWHKTEQRREIALYAGVCALVAGVTFALSLVAKFPFWGRHLAPVFPFYCALLVLGIECLLRTSWPTVVRVGAPAGLLALLAFSSAQVRWSPRHAKDDYRSAAAVAVSALRAGREVWWAADLEAAAYYGLVVSKGTPQPGKAARLLVATPKPMAPVALPDVIILSKRDIYDPGGEIDRLIAAHQFGLTQRFKAFTVWER
jgi:hypothetical protein